MTSNYQRALLSTSAEQQPEELFEPADHETFGYDK